MKNSHNVKARGLGPICSGKWERTEQAAREIEENLAVDPFDYVSRMERSYVDGRQKESFLRSSTPWPGISMKTI